MASQHCRHLSLLLPILLFCWLYCDAADPYNILRFELARKHDQWMAQHGRTYKDEAEKLRRFEIFKKNIKYIQDFNNNEAATGEYKYTLGEGPFTDLTTEEFLVAYTSEIEMNDPDNSFVRMDEEFEERLNNYTCPPSVDWKAKGAISSVKDQGSCGCSWAFAAASVIESQFKIDKGKLPDLSTQQLVDCGKSAPDGCRKGRVSDALSYVQEHGVTTSDNYPYKGKSCKCKKEKEAQPAAAIDGVTCTAVKSEEAVKALIAQRPAGMGIHVTPEFQHYKSGILHVDGPWWQYSVSGGFYGDPAAGPPNHAVQAVGYGKESDNTEYLTVKNSWGEAWGEGGFAKIPLKSSLSTRSATADPLLTPPPPPEPLIKKFIYAFTAKARPPSMRKNYYHALSI